MKIFKKDELFEIFKRKINALDPETQNSDELISETAGEYLERLLLRGHIPVHFIEDIQQYLMDEVKDMFRKKTYGFMNIETYKKAQKNKSRPRST
jgi:hypothetical protein